MDYKSINWADPKAKISKYFTVEEAIYLRNWNRLATEADGLIDDVKKNLVATAAKLDVIREFIGKPIFIKSWYRPKKYNVEIGGAQYSQHMVGNAVDFWLDADGDGDKDGKDCDVLKAKFMLKLEEWAVRMEDNGQGATWIHIDTRNVPKGGKRFFKP